jgi:hypothetical protein
VAGKASVATAVTVTSKRRICLPFEVLR